MIVIDPCLYSTAAPDGVAVPISCQNKVSSWGLVAPQFYTLGISTEGKDNYRVNRGGTDSCSTGMFWNYERMYSVYTLHTDVCTHK